MQMRVVPIGGVLAGLVVAGLGAGCASTGAVPSPFPQPGPAAGAARPPESHAGLPGNATGEAITTTALALRGTRYREGGDDPSGFDCSGLVEYVFAQHGLEVPRTVAAQFRAGQPVPDDRVEPGDLVFFTTVAPGASHVGIALGGGQFVHAPSEGGEVRVERLSAAYWASRYIGARRITPRSAAPSASGGGPPSR
ncbi:MAG TPA: C40 family peptidase [Vicinamibacterales bacterium]|nr:C40 family peptidase [Vicinamibacterales bacterium]